MKIHIGNLEIEIGWNTANKKLDKRLRELLAGGLVVEAIKTHRAATGSSLKDAKDYIDKLRGLK